MSLDKAEEIATTILYEGYILYPYRPSAIKNRQRCSFGTLFPESCEEVVCGPEACRNRTECLATATAPVSLNIQVRFLHLQKRAVYERVPDGEPRFQPVESLVVDGRLVQTWDEAVERTVHAEVELAGLQQPQNLAFEFSGSTEMLEVCDGRGEVVGRINRSQQSVRGDVRLSAERVQECVFRLTVDVVNTTFPASAGRDVALSSSLVSAHTILSVRGGDFVSLLNPPEHLREAAAACKNAGLYPVLVGAPGDRDMLLASPIILYDYPQVAPESAGNFFDSTEIDELLTLRVMTLTEAEKSEMRNADDRTCRLLERTEMCAREQLMRTHAAMRSLQPVEDKAG